MDKTFLETEEVMAYLRISRRTLYNLCRKGILTPHRVRGMRRVHYDAEEVERILRSNIIDENGKLDLVGTQKPP